MFNSHHVCLFVYPLVIHLHSYTAFNIHHSLVTSYHHSAVAHADTGSHSHNSLQPQPHLQPQLQWKQVCVYKVSKSTMMTTWQCCNHHKEVLTMRFWPQWWWPLQRQSQQQKSWNQRPQHWQQDPCHNNTPTFDSPAMMWQQRPPKQPPQQWWQQQQHHSGREGGDVVSVTMMIVMVHWHRWREVGCHISTIVNYCTSCSIDQFQSFFPCKTLWMWPPPSGFARAYHGRQN